MYTLSFVKKEIVNEYTLEDFGLSNLSVKSGINPVVFEFKISGITAEWASLINGYYALLYLPRCYYDSSFDYSASDVKVPTDTEYYQSDESPNDYYDPLFLIPLPDKFSSSSRVPGKILSLNSQPAFGYGMMDNPYFYMECEQKSSSTGNYAYINIAPQYREVELNIPGESSKQSGAWTQFPWGSLTEMKINGMKDNGEYYDDILSFDITLVAKCKLKTA